MPRVVIVGAGISGLATAFRLEQAAPAVEVIVLEQRDRPGGMVWTDRHAGYQVELGPNGFLDTKPSTRALCQDLGIADRLVAASESARRNRYLFLHDRLQPLPVSPLEIAGTGLLSWRGKLNLLAELFRPGRRSHGDESIDAFVRRRAGREIAEVFADALVTGIHGGDPKLLSVQAAFPRLAALEAKHGSIIKGMLISTRQRRQAAKRDASSPPAGGMWSFREGLRGLIEALQRALHQPPLLNIAVERVEKSTDEQGTVSWTIHAPGGGSWHADAVILACPSYQQAAILDQVDPELAQGIRAIAYNRIAVVALGYRREDIPTSLDGFGYITPQRTRRDVLGVQWCSSIFPERAPEGHVLLRAMCGGWHRAEVAGWEDARLLAAVRDDLRQALGIRALPLFHSITRWERAIPQYHLGHLDRVADIERRVANHPGLFVTGNAYHGVALNDCTEQAELVAARVASFLQGTTGRRSLPSR